MTHGKDDPHVYHRIILRPRPIKDPITGYTPDVTVDRLEIHKRKLVENQNIGNR